MVAWLNGLMVEWLNGLMAEWFNGLMVLGRGHTFINILYMLRHSFISPPPLTTAHASRTTVRSQSIGPLACAELVEWAQHVEVVLHMPHPTPHIIRDREGVPTIKTPHDA